MENQVETTKKSEVENSTPNKSKKREPFKPAGVYELLEYAYSLNGKAISIPQQYLGVLRAPGEDSFMNTNIENLVRDDIYLRVPMRLLELYVNTNFHESVSEYLLNFIRSSIIASPVFEFLKEKLEAGEEQISLQELSDRSKKITFQSFNIVIDEKSKEKFKNATLQQNVITSWSQLMFFTGKWDLRHLTQQLYEVRWRKMTKSQKITAHKLVVSKAFVEMGHVYGNLYSAVKTLTEDRNRLQAETNVLISDLNNASKSLEETTVQLMLLKEANEKFKEELESVSSMAESEKLSAEIALKHAQEKLGLRLEKHLILLEPGLQALNRQSYDTAIEFFTRVTQDIKLEIQVLMNTNKE